MRDDPAGEDIEQLVRAAPLAGEGFFKKRAQVHHAGRVGNRLRVL